MNTNIFFTKINAKNKDENANTLVFLHGWQSSGDAFLGNINHFSYNNNIVLIDFLGFGKSDVPSKPLDTILHAISIYELLLKENFKNIILVGHSFGGRVAVLLASMFNIKLKGLVLVASAGIMPKRSLLYYLKVYSYKFSKKLVAKKLLPKKFLRLFGSKDYKQVTGVMRTSLIQIVNQDLKSFLQNVNTKTLIVNGSKDKSVPLKVAKIFNKNIKRSELVVMKGKGHFCFLEDKLLFNKILSGFISSL